MERPSLRQDDRRSLTGQTQQTAEQTRYTRNENDDLSESEEDELEAQEANDPTSAKADLRNTQIATYDDPEEDEMDLEEADSDAESSSSEGVNDDSNPSTPEQLTDHTAYHFEGSYGCTQDRC